jgi:hypothetical protein
MPLPEAALTKWALDRTARPGKNMSKLFRKGRRQGEVPDATASTAQLQVDMLQ